jgi:hypothetical protein
MAETKNSGEGKVTQSKPTTPPKPTGAPDRAVREGGATKTDGSPKGQDPGPGGGPVEYEEALEKGYFGDNPDPTPNDNYTLTGVTSGAPTPETDRDQFEAAQERQGRVEAMFPTKVEEPEEAAKGADQKIEGESRDKQPSTPATDKK